MSTYSRRYTTPGRRALTDLTDAERAATADRVSLAVAHASALRDRWGMALNVLGLPEGSRDDIAAALTAAADLRRLAADLVGDLALLLSDAVGDSGEAAAEALGRSRSATRASMVRAACTLGVRGGDES